MRCLGGGGGPESAACVLLLGLGAVVAVPGVVVASPWWQHRRAEAVRRDVDRQRRDVEWRLYFGGTARCVAEAHWPGEFFTGRTAALREVARWLGQDGDDPVKLIVGGPGSGKSAVLGRVVMLADPVAGRTAADRAAAHPQAVPLPGSVSLSLSARGWTLAEIVSRIGAQAGIATTAVDELLLILQERHQPMVVVLDALNEAAEPELLARELVGRVVDSGSHVGLRLLVGVRRNMLPAIRPAGGQVLDLDTPTYFAAEDLVDYARKLLRSAGTPDPDRRRLDEVARGVARRAGTAFLIAQLTARALAQDPASWDTRTPGWEQRFPDSVGKAMDAYLCRRTASCAETRTGERAEPVVPPFIPAAGGRRATGRQSVPRCAFDLDTPGQMAGCSARRHRSCPCGSSARQAVRGRAHQAVRRHTWPACRMGTGFGFCCSRWRSPPAPAFRRTACGLSWRPRWAPVW
jgi:CTP:molybdopterin cytidylyltransferase MocA